jgi:hypothetical protein
MGQIGRSSWDIHQDWHSVFTYISFSCIVGFTEITTDDGDSTPPGRSASTATSGRSGSTSPELL